MPFARRQPGQFPDIIADKHRFERHGGLRALIAWDFGIQGGDDFQGGRLLVTQVDEAILEDIKAQEENLRATSQTISLKAPIDGMVSVIEHYPGSKIVPNLPIVTISATNATRIVGYIRRPFGVLPKANDTVQIRRQSFKREVAIGTITEVSGQLEVIPSTLVPTPTGTTGELGLPFSVSIPAELALIPGEPVDLIFK